MAIQPLHAYLWGPYSRACATAAVATFIADQAHKAWMLIGMGIRDLGRVTVTPFLDYVFVLNRGVSYGLFPGAGQWLLTIFALATSVALWVWVARTGSGRLMGVSLGLVIGGALGNALDRVLHGGVVDYFSLHAFGFYWYVFNFADAAIVAGVIGLLYESMIANRSRNDAANGAQNGAGGVAGRRDDRG